MNRILVKYKIYSIFFLSLAGVVILLQACNIAEPEAMIKPGRLKIKIIYSTNLPSIQDSDSLFVQARDFKIFKDSLFADVFQNPNQFLAFEDSIVSFNIFEGVLSDSAVQVAYGSIAPLTYDSLLFQLAPGELMRRDGNLYPITTNYSSLGPGMNFTNIVKISDKIKIRENKTTTLTIKFILEKNVFRYLDQFVFVANVDTFFISNE